jgi:hypothetical protein
MKLSFDALCEKGYSPSRGGVKTGFAKRGRDAGVDERFNPSKSAGDETPTPDDIKDWR